MFAFQHGLNLGIVIQQGIQLAWATQNGVLVQSVRVHFPVSQISSKFAYLSFPLKSDIPRLRLVRGQRFSMKFCARGREFHHHGLDAMQFDATDSD